jgi:hypothetical protein
MEIVEALAAAGSLFVVADLISGLVADSPSIIPLFSKLLIFVRRNKYATTASGVEQFSKNQRMNL